MVKGRQGAQGGLQRHDAALKAVPRPAAHLHKVDAASRQCKGRRSAEMTWDAGGAQGSTVCMLRFEA